MLPTPPSADRPIDVLGIGFTSVDFVYLLPACPSPESALASRAAGEVRRRRRLRRQRHARRRELESRGVDVRDVIVRPGAANQFAVILVARQTGERIVLWDRDAQLRPGRPEAR